MLHNPQRRGLLVDAMRHRMGEIENRRTPKERPEHTVKCGQFVEAAHHAINEFEATLIRKSASCANR